jgi:hypothetical protein
LPCVSLPFGSDTLPAASSAGDGDLFPYTRSIREARFRA